MKFPTNDQIFWLFEMGKPKRKANLYFLRDRNFEDLQRPVFFLSTGRTGTMWFAKLLQKDKQLKVYHAAVPDLAIQCKKIYTHKKGLFDQESEEFKLITEIFLAGREEYFRYAYKCKKRFVETNNQLVFFAPVIAKILPNSVFVHLYRHPGEFVRSGLRRGWYEEGNLMNQKLIKPADTEYWKNLSALQKISWLWNETNQFIEEFKRTLPKERYFNFNFNNLSVNTVAELINFLNADISAKHIKRTLTKKENMQKSGNIECYENWAETDKKQLKVICNELAENYGYKL